MEAKRAMGALGRALKSGVAVLLACAIGTMPACGSMGGGMRYFAPDLTWSAPAAV